MAFAQVAALYLGVMANGAPYLYEGNNFSNYAFCGGTIISQRHIITARHCINGLEKIENTTGSVANWWIQASQLFEGYSIHPSTFHHLKDA
jgi:secreted trypsin-like serine protease